MTALDVLLKLDQLGCRVLLEGGNIRVIPPEGVNLTDELRREIREHKPELVALLRREEKEPKNPAQEAAKGRALLQRRGYVLIYSHLLGETIALVQPDFRGELPEAVVSYTTEEIKLLKDLNEEDLRLLHKAKKELGGTVVPYLERSREMDKLAKETLDRLAAVHPEGALPWAEKHRPDLLEMCNKWKRELNRCYEDLDLGGFRAALAKWERAVEQLFNAYRERD